MAADSAREFTSRIRYALLYIAEVWCVSLWLCYVCCVSVTSVLIDGVVLACVREDPAQNARSVDSNILTGYSEKGHTLSERY